MKEDIINLNNLSAFNKEMQNELITTFLEQASSLIRKIKQQIDDKDFVLLNSTAHYFKGSCLALGAERMASVCRILEKKGKDSDLSETQPLIKDLEANYILIEQHIKSHGYSV